jgi:hypothetical protein
VQRYLALFGSEIEVIGRFGATTYRTRGDFGRYMISMAKDIDYHFSFAEFVNRSEVQNSYSHAGRKPRASRAKARLLGLI